MKRLTPYDKEEISRFKSLLEDNEEGEESEKLRCTENMLHACLNQREYFGQQVYALIQGDYGHGARLVMGGILDDMAQEPQNVEAYLNTLFVYVGQLAFMTGEKKAAEAWDELENMPEVFKAVKTVMLEQINRYNKYVSLT